MLIRGYVQVLTAQQLHTSPHLNVCLVISKRVAVLFIYNFYRHILRNCSTSYIDALVYISAIYDRNVLPKYDKLLLKHPVYA